jgi:hypothetical protein
VAAGKETTQRRNLFKRKTLLGNKNRKACWLLWFEPLVKNTRRRRAAGREIMQLLKKIRNVLFKRRC